MDAVARCILTEIHKAVRIPDGIAAETASSDRETLFSRFAARNEREQTDRDEVRGVLAIRLQSVSAWLRFVWGKSVADTDNESYRSRFHLILLALTLKFDGGCPS